MAECPSQTSAESILKLLQGLSQEDRQYVLSRAEGGVAADESSANATGAEAAQEEDGGMGWTEIVVLGMGVLLLIHVLGTVLWEVKRYKQIHAANDKGVSDYLKYRFGLWYSRTPGAAGIVLFFMSVVLLVVGGMSYSVMAGSSIAESLWAAWIWIVAPDGGGSAEGYYGRIAGLFTSCGGMLIFAMLMSIISAKFEEMLDMFKNSGLPVVEGDHIVLLGWSPMVPFLVDELCNSKEGSGGCTIVILTPLDKVAVEEKLEDADIDYRNSDVVVRSGDRRKTEDLEAIALSSAATVIVVSKADETREDSDARQLNVLSAMKSKKWPIDGTVLVQCMLKTNSKLFGEYCHSEKKEVIVTGDLLGSLMVHCTQQRGLAQATLQLLGFEGAEFYDLRVEGISGKTFRDLVFGLPGAMAVGIVRGESWELLPSMDTKFAGDERIIMLADDETTCPKKLDEARIRSSFPQDNNSRFAGVKQVVKQLDEHEDPETVLIIGWNETVGAVLVELDKVLAEKSKVVIFSPVPIADREAFIKAALKRRGKDKYKYFDVEHRAGPMCARTRLAELPLDKAARVFVLSDSSSKQPRDADASAVAVCIQLMDICQERQKDVASSMDRVIVPQILLASTVEHFQSMGLPDYIVSDHLTASICAQVALNPDMRPMIEELLSDSGCSLKIRKLMQYPDLAGEKNKDEITFTKIAKRAAMTGEVALGYKLTMSAEEEWTLNPKDWRSPLEWNEESRIASLSRTRSKLAIQRASTMSMGESSPGAPRRQYTAGSPKGKSPECCQQT
mmetsp:Transcript_6753/g.12469  ORF Transcript_6753/g.12469 Transcript_6753/m.12469 type:complete len:787 (+) Transcript_6753:78-2438(+)